MQTNSAMPKSEPCLVPTTYVISMTLRRAEHLRWLRNEAGLHETVPAISAVKAFWNGMVVDIVEANSLICGLYFLLTSGTGLAKRFFVALHAVRILVPRNVFAASQGFVTHLAAEMFDMPRFVLCLGISLVENELVTGGASWQHGIGEVATAVELASFKEVNQILQDLVASATGEARRMPALVIARSGSEDGHVARKHWTVALNAVPLHV